MTSPFPTIDDQGVRRELKRLLKPDGSTCNVIDSFKKGLFIPAYMRTLRKSLERKGESSDGQHGSDDMGISTYVVVASSKKLEQEDFIESMRPHGRHGCGGPLLPSGPSSNVPERQSPVILTDDYVPVDNLIAPIFEERYGYRK